MRRYKNLQKCIQPKFVISNVFLLPAIRNKHFLCFERKKRLNDKSVKKKLRNCLNFKITQSKIQKSGYLLAN